MEQHECPLIGEWIKTMWGVCVCTYIYMYTYVHTQWSIDNRMIISHKKNNEVLPFVTTWMDPESIMLSEISQR